LCIGGSVAHVCDDSGEEVGEAGEGIVAAEVDGGVDIVLVVPEPGEELLPVDFGLCGGVTSLETFDGKGLVLLLEKLRSTGRVGEEEVDDWSEKDGWDAFCGSREYFAG
jgi:hypothetical protein